MKEIAVTLLGCGVFDGAEIHQSILTLLAPDKEQVHLINHLEGSIYENETRNVLRESDRIVRG